MMLTSLLGIRLVLWTGPTVPIPPPLEVMHALVRATVTNDASGGDGFQLTFTLGKGLIDYNLIGGALEQWNRVILGVILGATPEVLIDGIITHVQVNPSNEPGASTITVSGRDVSIMLDLEEKNASYPNQPDFLIVTRLIASYAQYGLVPNVTPTTDFPIMLQRVPRQAETDFQFIQRLAKKNGFVFYVEPLTFGLNNAYFGPENRLGLPQPALSVALGPSTNVDDLNFANDGLAATGTSGEFTIPYTNITVPIPSLPSLKIPPLATSPTPAKRTTILREGASEDSSQAATDAIATVTNAPDAVTADGTLDGVRYGAVLRARRLVGLRGVGMSYGGTYFVRRVTHTIEVGKSYSQSFSLSREGTGALPPLVVP